MAGRYLHVQIELAQASREHGAPCGDMVAEDRSPTGTTIVCADGVGHGIRASVAANMVASRLLGLVRSGFSLRAAFASVVKTMQAAKGTDLPYVAFSLARILNDGETTILSFEAPGPILVGKRQATVLRQRPLVLEGVVTEEATCHLDAGEGLLLCTDGITQAGLGGRLRGGWGIEAAAQYVTDLLARGLTAAEIPARLNDEAARLSVGTPGDDCTTLIASCRPGQVVTILTGPPSDRRHDREVAQRFLATEGAKVICGATTADIVARVLGVEVGVDQSSHSLLAPPSYVLEGVDLVTEGAVTLNQLHNVLDEDPEAFDEDSGVTELYNLLRAADRVNILHGTAQNPANRHISFRQRGILPRHTILDLLSQRLREQGKLVVLEHV